MKESSKSMSRRREEDANGYFPWSEVFNGSILDVGAGTDPIPLANVTPFDKADGNAELIARYFEPQSFHCAHLSQCLEHLSDPVDALRQAISLVKPGGYVVFTVPDWGAYERFRFPSRWNLDHRSTWSMVYPNSNAPIHVHLPSWLEQFKDEVVVLMARYVERNYDWSKPDSVDQTFPEDGAECWCEVVLQVK